MLYENYYWGMNLIWWFLWVGLVFWIFATPYDIPGQMRSKDSALEILQKRFASGQLTNEQYQEKKKILEHDMAQ